MAECGCWGVGAWASLVLGVVASALFLAALARLAASHRRLARLADERDAAREALLDATVRREVAEADRADHLDLHANGPLDIRLLAETEVRRAARYGRAVTLVLLRWPEALAGDDPRWTRLEEVFRGQLRESDRAGHLDASTAAVVLPETDRPVAEAVAERLVAEVHRVLPGGAPLRSVAAALTPGDATAEAILSRLVRELEPDATLPDQFFDA